jgi:hypothetical protein
MARTVEEFKRTPEFEAMMDKLTKELADRGLLVEAGWIGLRRVWLPPDAPEHQVKDLRWAFMAGAQHLYSSMMTILDEGDDATQLDLDRMAKIHNELDAFMENEVKPTLPTQGRS